MSFDYWLFFYDEWLADADLAAHNTNETPASRSNAGGHHERLPADYWAVREAFMRSAPVPPNGVPLIRPGEQPRNAFVRPAPPVVVPPRPFTEDERADMLTAMKSASSLRELKGLSAKLARNRAT